MTKDIQQIRESQFVLIYGPGSIIESKMGSRLIPDINHCLGNNYSDSYLKDMSIDDDLQMSTVIRDIEEIPENIHLFSMLSTESQNKSSFEGSYNTYIFPTWKICHNVKKHKGKGSILYNGLRPDKKYLSNKCPICSNESNSNVRFLVACDCGHLDDIDWIEAVHHFKDNVCKTNHLIWKPAGSGLKDIKIQCPVCKAEVSMLQIYKMYKDGDFPCKGRYPEKENPISYEDNVSFPEYGSIEYKECNAKVRVMQKQSSSLRVANTLTLLKMPKNDILVLNVLRQKEYSTLKFLIKENIITTSEKILKMVKDISSNDFSLIKSYFDDNSFETFKKIFLSSYEESKLEDVLLNECDVLCNDNVEPSIHFEKGQFKKIFLKNKNNMFKMKICPVNRLKTVTAQVSYQRTSSVSTDNSDNLLNKRVSSCHRIGNERWYPAYEGFGEGIFITSDMNPIEFFNLTKLYDEWKKVIHTIPSGSRKDLKNPTFVWWHTLSHAIINSLSLYCGYNASTLKERVYIHPQGGILIYNTSPGDDSGMGGLVDIAADFQPVLDNAIENILSCSNDPLCMEEFIEPGRVNGSACHNCLLISETSCEHRNMLLDRQFFIEM